MFHPSPQLIENTLYTFVYVENFISITSFEILRELSMWSTLDFDCLSTVRYLRSCRLCLSQATSHPRSLRVRHDRGEAVSPQWVSVHHFNCWTNAWQWLTWKPEQTLVFSGFLVPKWLGTLQSRICLCCAQGFCLTLLQMSANTRSVVRSGNFDKAN